ncbi:M4 family metallopeptidase [Actinomadura xylanilytica]|uniref:M4 family metallopeptidase n=1 Tax=Actinomadura xylanilytica TaxID=887459 RepID=UPI00255B04B7|nr:M4 family metallopeptidase [Actinomadura xylanilytica]MDL4773089.1 M4 family metallopeptidase [Actinomadura xylanilytica]
MRRQTALGTAAIAAGLAVAMSSPATGATTASGASAPPPPSPKAAAASADQLVSSGKAPIHASPKDKVVRRGVTAGAGGLQYVAYERVHAGLPVRGGDFVVATDAAGTVLGTSVGQSKELSVSTTPKLTAAKAAAISRTRITKATRTGAATLAVLTQGAGRLVYETVVEGTNGTGRTARPSRLHVYVDAVTGKAAGQWDEVRDANDDQSFYHGGSSQPTSISTTASGGTYSLRDATRSGISCANQSGTVYSGSDDAWGNANGTNLETACVDAMKAAQSEFDMVKTWLERNGLNGSGSGWPMRVGLNQANAFWNGSYANFGRNSSGSRQATTTDVVAHELGHGVFQYTPGGSGWSNESGGLNESTGDVFGALTEWYQNEPRVTEQISGSNAVLNYDPPDYQVGEEVDLVGSGPIRSMSNPSSISGNPNCYSSSVPNMEVHAAAGVQNHWFYLLAEGSAAGDPSHGRPNSPTCNGSAVTGVGVQKAGRIFMETLNLKTSTWTHITARKTSLQAVLNLVQVGKATCTDFTRTRDAWNAVSVPAASGEPASCTG